jgi:hypothetical protein
MQSQKSGREGMTMAVGGWGGGDKHKRREKYKDTILQVLQE